MTHVSKVAHNYMTMKGLSWDDGDTPDNDREQYLLNYVRRLYDKNRSFKQELEQRTKKQAENREKAKARKLQKVGCCWVGA